MIYSALRHIHGRRQALAAELDLGGQFELWEESCVPSYCHRNLAAAYLSWARLYAAVRLARQCARTDAILDFGAAVGELRRLLPDTVRRYDFVEESDAAAKYLVQQIPDAHRHSLKDAPDGDYSVVFALDSLEHNKNYPEILAALVTKLQPEGVLILSGPTENTLYRLGRRIAGFDAHYHETNIYAIEATAQEHLTRLRLKNLPPLAPLFRLSAWRKRDQT